MFPNIPRKLRTFGLAVALVVSLCLVVYGLLSLGGSSSPSRDYVLSEPGESVWQLTGQYTVERLGVTLNIHTFFSRSDQIVATYSAIHSLPGFHAVPKAISIQDDTGASYRTINHSILGNALGVTAGVVITEPYQGNGRTLTLITDGMDVIGGSQPEALSGTWAITFIENRSPGATLASEEGGRISDEVLTVGNVTIGLAGPPGGDFIKLLVDRQGNQAKIYGVVSQRVARGTSETEFRQLLLQAQGYSDFPPIPGFPAPEAAPAEVKRSLPEEEAFFIALEAASHLIGDEGIQSRQLEALAYHDALARLSERGLGGPGGEQQPAQDSTVWLVSLTGLFYEPAGPGASSETGGRRYVCSEILVLVDDESGEAIQLALLELESCPNPTGPS